MTRLQISELQTFHSMASPLLLNADDLFISWLFSLDTLVIRWKCPVFVLRLHSGIVAAFYHVSLQLVEMLKASGHLDTRKNLESRPSSLLAP